MKRRAVFEEPYVADTASGALLLFGAWTSVRCWRALPRSRASLFWMVAGVGLALLGIDELIGFHERFGERVLPAMPWLNHADDIIMLGYAAGAAALVLAWWREIVIVRPTARWMALAVAATALAALVDGFAPGGLWLWAWVEEAAELTAAMAAVIALRARLAAAGPVAPKQLAGDDGAGRVRTG